MDKRKAPRFKRRIQLRFWSVDDRTPRKGFTQNVSVTGMFISSSSPFKPGTRIFVEVASGSEKLVLQAEVRYSARVDPALQKVRPSGMGVRFLTVEELMSELLKLRRSIAENAEQLNGNGDAEESEIHPVLGVTFSKPRDLATSYERDVKYGGLFIPTEEDVEQDDRVVIEFRFGWDESLSIRAPAKVVKRFAAAEGTTAGETVSGVGVAFTDSTLLTSQFSNVLSDLDQVGSAD